MLERFGFSQREESIFLFLTVNGPHTAGQVATQTKIDRRTTYDALRRLQQKGYVGVFQENDHAKYRAMDPDTFEEKAQELLEDAKKLKPQLQKMPDVKSQESVSVALYSGQSGIRHVLDMIISAKKYQSIGSSEEWLENLPIEYDYFQTQKKIQNVTGKTVLGSKLKNSKIHQKISKQTTIRFFDEKHPAPVSIFIFKNTVALFIFKKPFNVIVMTGRNVVDAYKSYFDSMWEDSK